MSSKDNASDQSVNPWKLVYNDFKPDNEKSRESLLAIGNGYLGNRGAMEESVAGDHHYPGTYIAGLYNRLVSKVAERDIVNEDFVNCPNWHRVRFRTDGGDWFDIKKDSIESIYRELSLRDGILKREMVVKDVQGRRTSISSERFASMADPHLLGMRYVLSPINYDGKIELELILDGDLINDGVARYRDLEQNHLVQLEEGSEGEYNWILVKTRQSDIEIAEASLPIFWINNIKQEEKSTRDTDKGKSFCSISADLKAKDELCLRNVVSVFTSKPDDSRDPLKDALQRLKNTSGYEELKKASRDLWDMLWGKMDIKIDGDPKSQMLVRLHLYHLLVTASPHNIDIDAGISARGLHGEAYRGHIFWDELYILPVYSLFFPEISKSVLKYRYNRLNKAREYAKECGYEGAMFPWQSGSDGREETQVLHLNPISGEWGDDYSSLQRHISIAVAYNVWYYYHMSGDQVFMTDYGAEIFLDICRFWAKKAEKSEETGRYSIRKVMGPDEFHELHPLSPEGGVKDNAYTNIMVAWLFKRALEIWGKLDDEIKQNLSARIGINEEEVYNWQNIASLLFLNISDEGIISQFDGYFDLSELDWDGYREKYENIYRLDRILKAEGKSPDEFKLAKQADTLMTYYNLDASVIRELIRNMGYSLEESALRKNYEYYIQRTSHGSSLSRVVHAYLANQMGEYDLGWELYKEALESDYTDIQGGTTAEGIHAGVMGGTVLMVVTSFLGVNLKKDHLIIDPHLPDSWDRISLSLSFKNRLYQITCEHQKIEIEIKSREKGDLLIELCGKKIVLQANHGVKLEY